TGVLLFAVEDLDDDVGVLAPVDELELLLLLQRFADLANAFDARLVFVRRLAGGLRREDIHAVVRRGTARKERQERNREHHDPSVAPLRALTVNGRVSVQPRS